MEKIKREGTTLYQAFYQVLFMGYLIQSTWLLQMSKLRHREVGWFAYSQIACKCRTKILLLILTMLCYLITHPLHSY
jgi:hypothetical protein